MPDPAAPSQDAGDDLRADLTGAWDAQESPSSGTTSSPEVEPSPPAGAAQPSTPPPEGAAGGDRARNPDGTFAKGAKTQPAAVEGAAQPAPAGFQIPEKWPADVRAKLAEIHAANPAHAEWLLGQYTTMRSIAAQQHQKANEHLKTYDQYLAPGRQERMMRGVDDATHVKHLLAGDDFIRKNPEAGIRWIAQQNGIDLAKLANPSAEGEPQIPPYVAELQKEVQQFKQMFQQQAVGMEQQQLHAASSWIDSFASQKDEQGQPLYPYFDELLPEIIYGVQYQMQNGQQVDVKAAYDRAKRMNDSVWLKDQRARSEAADKAKAAQRQREIEDAKRAGITVSGSGADTTQQPGSVREELLRAFDSAG